MHEVLRQLFHRHAGGTGKADDILIFQLNDILVDLTVAGLEHGDFPVILRSFRFEFADFRVHSSSLW